MAEQEGCKKCNQKNTYSGQILTIILGFWVLGTSIVGSAIVFGKIIDYIKVVFGISH